MTPAFLNPFRPETFFSSHVFTLFQSVYKKLCTKYIKIVISFVSYAMSSVNFFKLNVNEHA